MQQLIERDKFNHNLKQHKSGFKNNMHIQDPVMPIWDDKYHNKQNLDNHFFPNSAKSSSSQKPHNFRGPPPAEGHNGDLNFEFFEPPRHKLFTSRDRGKRRLRKQQKRKRPRHPSHPRPAPPASPAVDPFMDLDYIEEIRAVNEIFTIMEMAPTCVPIFSGLTMLKHLLRMVS